MLLAEALQDAGQPAVDHLCGACAKAYPVTVAGSGKADVTAGKLAAYGQNFRFSVSRTDLTEYAVSAVVDGDANGSGVLDVNDAQMIYDMYMSVYKLDELT